MAGAGEEVIGRQQSDQTKHKATAGRMAPGRSRLGQEREVGVNAGGNCSGSLLPEGGLEPRDGAGLARVVLGWAVAGAPQEINATTRHSPDPLRAFSHEATGEGGGLDHTRLPNDPRASWAALPENSWAPSR